MDRVELFELTAHRRQFPRRGDIHMLCDKAERLGAIQLKFPKRARATYMRDYRQRKGPS